MIKEETTTKMSFFFYFYSRVVNVYKNIHKMLSSIEYLTDKEWKFSTENIIALRNSLLDTDSQVTILYNINKKNKKNFNETLE